MAVPKQKTSKQRTHTRAANWKLEAPAMGECSHCHAMKLSHRVCDKCGYYNGKLVVAPKEKKKAE